MLIILLLKMTRKYPERTALFPGTFNPFTVGHKSVVDRGLALFDRIIIAVGVNAAKSDNSDIEERLEAIRRVYAANDRVSVISYSGLTVDACREYGADFILRGVRSVRDFEYERDLADGNRNISGIETVLLYAEPELSWISSSIVRDLARHGSDISKLIP